MDVADAKRSLSRVLAGQGRYREALEAARNALALRRRIVEPNQPVIGLDLAQVGMIHLEMENWEMAERALLESSQILERWPIAHRRDLASNALAMGRLYRLQSRFPESERRLMAALDIRARVFGEKHYLYSRVLHELGDLQATMNRPDEAANLYHRELDILKTRLPRHPELAECLGQIAALHLDQNRPLEARAFLNQALELCREACASAAPIRSKIEALESRLALLEAGGLSSPP